MASERRFRSSTLARIALATAVTTLTTSCSEEQASNRDQPTTPEQNRRETFFWRDRLSIPPFEEPVSEDREQWIAQILAVEVERGANSLDQVDAIRRLEAPLDALEAALLKTAAAPLKIAIVIAAAERGAAAAPLLCRALRQTPVEVAIFAARALGRVDAPWTLPRLIKELGQYDAHPDLIVRVEAAASLLRRQNFAPIPMLLKVLKEHTRLQDDREREWPTRMRIAFEKEEAWRALEPILGEGLRFSPNAPYEQQADVITQVEERYRARRTALWADSPDLDDPGILAIIDRLVSGFEVFQIRNVDNARFALAALGPKAIPRLVTHLTDSPVYVRVHVLEVLQQLAVYVPKSSLLEEAARARLMDSTAAVRAEATRLLGQLRSETAPKAVLGISHDEDPSVRLAAIMALGVGGNAAGDARLREISEGAQGDEWAAAHAALFRRGQPDRLDALVRALVDGSLSIRAAALDALLWLGADTATFPLTGDQAARAVAADLVEASVPPITVP